MNKYFRLLILFSACLLISCIVISYQKLMWVDELFSYYSTQDPDLGHSIKGISTGINAVPPLYFIITWSMFRAGIESEHFYRLFSSICLIVSLLLLWRELRNHVPAGVAALCILFTAGGSNLIFVMNTEFRYYGLFFLFESLAVIQALILFRSAGAIKNLFLFGLFTGLSCLTHVFGIFYGMAFIFVYLIHSFLVKRLQTKNLLAVLFGLSLMGLWARQLLMQSDTGKPHSWIAVPGYSALKSMLSYFIPYLEVVNFHYKLFIFMITILLVILYLFRKSIYIRIVPIKNIRTSNNIFLLLLGAGLVFIPVLVVYVISKNFVSVFHERYFIPSVLGVILMLSGCISTIKVSPGRWSYYFTCMLCLLGILRLIQFTKVYIDPQELVYKIIHDKTANENLPVIFESAINFLPFQFYYKDIKSVFPLDWDLAIHPKNQLNACPEFKLMKSMKAFYSIETVETSESIMQQDSIFYVVDESKRFWYEFYAGSGKLTLAEPPVRINDFITLKKVRVIK